MLSGEYRHSLDPKNRIFIPAKHREELGETFMIACSFREKCLKVYSLTGWGEYIAPIEKQDRQLAERVLRFLHRTAVQVTPDKQGRVILPENLKTYAEIDKDLMVIGCGKCDEIWSEKLYNEKVLGEDLDDMKKQMQFLGL